MLKSLLGSLLDRCLGMFTECLDSLDTVHGQSSCHPVSCCLSVCGGGSCCLLLSPGPDLRFFLHPVPKARALDLFFVPWPCQDPASPQPGPA